MLANLLILLGIAGGYPLVLQDDNLEQFHIPPDLF
jgi:hypothetical protein